MRSPYPRELAIHYPTFCTTYASPQYDTQCWRAVGESWEPAARTGWRSTPVIGSGLPVEYEVKADSEVKKAEAERDATKATNDYKEKLRDN